jgi:hypothetical protein
MGDGGGSLVDWILGHGCRRLDSRNVLGSR